MSNTVGAVLDPIFSLRCRVRLQPNESVQVVFTTGVAESIEQARALSEKYYDAGIFERESRMADAGAGEMNHLHIDPTRPTFFRTRWPHSLHDPSLRPRRTFWR